MPSPKQGQEKSIHEEIKVFLRSRWKRLRRKIPIRAEYNTSNLHKKTKEYPDFYLLLAECYRPHQKDVGGAFGRVITRLCALADNRLPTSLGRRRSRRCDHITIQQHSRILRYSIGR